MSTPLTLNEPELGLPLMSKLRMSLLQTLLGAAADRGLAEFRASMTEELNETLAEGRGVLRAAYQTWALFRLVALAGVANGIQVLRDEYIAGVKGYVTGMYELAHSAREIGFDTPELERFEAEVAEFDRRMTRIATRWQTAEDLEDLAAESLAPSREKFLAIRDALPFPQAWYEENTKPF